MIELFEDIKVDKEDKSIYRDKETRMPLFQTEKVYKGQNAKFHPDFLELHTEVNKGLFRTSFLRQRDKDSLEFAMRSHYEDLADHNFRHPHRIEDYKTEDGETGVNLFHKDTNEKIAKIKHNYDGSTLTFDKEFLEKKGVNPDLSSAYEKNINSPRTAGGRIEKLNEFLDKINKVPKVVGLTQSPNSASYKKGEGVSDEEAVSILLKHHKAPSNSYQHKGDLDWKHVGNNHYVAHEDGGMVHHLTPKQDGTIVYNRFHPNVGDKSTKLFF